jgi:RNA polymerase sigma-70 factor (ECF subfamily)
MESATSGLYDEQELAIRAKADSSAFAELYDHYFPRVYGYALYRLQDAQAADGVTAQTFEKTLTNIKRYQPARGSFGAWIFAIARNTINKHLRAQKVRRWVSLDAVSHQLVEDSPSVEEIVARDEMLARLMPLIKELDGRKRDLLAFKFGAGLTNRRIAQLTGLTESNVGVILYRTLHHLREQLREEDEYEEGHEF